MPTWSATEAAQAKALSDAGQTNSEIAEYLQRPKSSVGRVIRKARDHGTYEHLPRSGRPPKLDRRSKSRVLRTMDHGALEVERFKSFESIAMSENLEISGDTLRKWFKKEGLNSRRAKRTVALTELVKKKRKSAAEEVQTVDWSTVLFVDECSVDLHVVGGRKKRVIRRREEQDDPRLMVPQNAASRETIMVFAAVGLDYKSPIIKVSLQKAQGSGKNRTKKETINSDKYGRMIDEFLAPWYYHFQAKLPPGVRAKTLEDNATSHNTLNNKKKREDYSMLRLCHPPRSPDLNAVETCWGMMKHLLKAVDKFASSIPKLEQEIQKAWDSLDQENINRQVLKMKERYELVLSNNGGAIPDWHDTKPDPDSVPERRPLVDVSNIH